MPTKRDLDLKSAQGSSSPRRAPGGWKKSADDLDPSIPFAIAHWTAYEGPETEKSAEVNDGHRDFRCDMFNPVTRLCEAHDDRPPVCRIYPHEPEARGGALITRGLYNRCSYWLDVPAAERPEGIRPLIPLTVKGTP